MPSKRPTFRAFNGLRIVAALGVVVFHYGVEVRGFFDLPDFPKRLASLGLIGLGFFYVLSGFVLAYAYADRLPSTPAARQSFWFARFARLYPVYLLGMVAFLPMAIDKYLLHPDAGRQAGTFAVGALLTLPALQAWTPYALSWNGPGWSLSVEAFFYLLFPFIVLPVLRLPWWRLVAALLVLLCGMVGVAAARNANWIPVDTWSRWIEYNPLVWTPFFLLGIATFRWHRQHPLRRGVAAAMLGAGSLAAIVLIQGSLDGHGRQILVYGGAAPLLVLVVLAFAHTTSVASRAFGSRALYVAGAASYATYILQGPVWHVYTRATNRFTHHAGEIGVELWQFLSYVVVLLLCSQAALHWVELPAQRWLLQWRSGRERRREPRLDPGIEAI